MLHANEQGGAENNGIELNDSSPIQSNAEDVCVRWKLEQAVHDTSSNLWGAEKSGECGGLLRPPPPLQSPAQTVRDIWRCTIQRAQRIDLECFPPTLKSINRFQMRRANGANPEHKSVFGHPGIV
jgi:hypothetical protein